MLARACVALLSVTQVRATAEGLLRAQEDSDAIPVALAADDACNAGHADVDGQVACAVNALQRRSEKKASDAQPKLVYGTPLSGYHNVTMYVYMNATISLGYEPRLINTYIHQILYPMFTGRGGKGDPAANCEEEGCPEYCEKEGLGRKSPCVDFIVDSNIPVNHGTWLQAYTDTFDVIGTAFEDQAIGLWAPNYTGWKTISDAANAENVEKTVISFKGTPEYQCAMLNCPKCGNGDLPYLVGGPIKAAGFGYESYECPVFVDLVAKKLEQKENFIMLQWTPQALMVRFPEMVELDMQQYATITRPNQGKVLLNKESRWKFPPKLLSVMSAIFIGTHDVALMDGWAHNFGGVKLCDYDTWSNNCAKEAADKWIAMNSIAHGDFKSLWDSFFW